MNCQQNQTVSWTLGEHRLASALIMSPAISAHSRPPPLPPLPNRSVITVHLYAAALRLLAAISPLLSPFLGLFPRLSKSPPPVLADYYILENNSQLKAALKYKRIQLTDFRNVPMEHFGESGGGGGGFRLLLNRVANEGMDAFFFFPQKM